MTNKSIYGYETQGNKDIKAKNLAPKNSKKKKNKKRKNRFDYNKLGIVTVVVCILVFVIYNVITMINVSSIKTIIVDIGEVSRTVQREMVIIKDEKVLYAPSDGYFELIYPEGERVKKGIAIAKTKNQSSNENYRYLIELIDSRIASLRNNSEQKSTEAELSKTNNRLDYLYREIQNRINTGDLEYIDILKKEIISLNNKKQYLVPLEDGHIKTVEELKVERSELENLLKSKNFLVYSNYIGVLTPYYDGYEDSLKIDKIRELSVSDIKKIKDRPPVDYSIPKIKGDALGRIVDNYKWYLACEITKEDIEYIQSEKPVYIYIEDKKIKAYLEDFYKGKDKKFVGYFRVEDENFKFYEKRKYMAGIEYQYLKGLKIPISALVEKNQKMGVYVVDRTGTAIFKEIPKVESKNNEFFAIPYEATYKKDLTKVNLYDEIIINPKNVIEGRKVK
ncbi:MAG: HlyD family efflux transporter periplasmic adaptor subunit [Proteocatella sp.]